MVLGVNVDEDPDAYQKFLVDHGVIFPTWRDPSVQGTIFQDCKDYGTTVYPETYVIDRKGKIARKIISEQRLGFAGRCSRILTRCSPRSEVFSLQFFSLQSSVFSLQSSVFSLQSLSLQSSVFSLQSSVFSPSVFSLQSFSASAAVPPGGAFGSKVPCMSGCGPCKY